MFVTSQLNKFHNETNCFAYEFFGCHKIADGKYVFRVWAPRAKAVSLVGSFNQWLSESSVMNRLSDNESFEIVTEASVGDTYKFLITTFDGRKLYKADPYAFYSDYPKSFASKIVDLPDVSEYIYDKKDFDKPVNIYEVCKKNGLYSR